MGALYTYSEARQKFAKILEQAASEGEVLVKRKDDQVFVIKPLIEKSSPDRNRVINVHPQLFDRHKPLIPGIVLGHLHPYSTCLCRTRR